MIDSKLLENDLDESVRKLARKGEDEVKIRALAGQLLLRKKQKTALDDLRSELNKISKSIGSLIASGDAAAADEAKQRTGEVKAEIQAAEEVYRVLDEEIEFSLLRVPNFPSDACPDGKGEEDNVVRRTEGYDPADFAGHSYKPHWEVAEALGIYDAQRAAKLSGSMFSVLRGDGAKLLQALVQLGLAMNRPNYIEIAPPHFVSTETFTATGHLPKFAADAYKMAEEDLWAIPTGEVPLMGLHRDEILEVDELPIRYMAYTVCFRREAGSAGKDTRGLQRLHEFHKVELLKLCRAEQIETEYAAMLADAERLLATLKLPYRVLDLCGGDLTFSSQRIFDLEVYSPGVDKWLEVSSVGQFGDFQARRGNIRYRDPETKKLQFVHALNGSGIATPRVWAAVIEHNQQPDGSVKIPEALQAYMGKDVIAAG